MDLKGKKGLIIGIANDKSIAYGCAKSLISHGCEDLIVTYQSSKTLSYMQESCNEIGIKNFIEFNYTGEDSVIKLFNEVIKIYPEIDFIIHSLAFADNLSLQGGIVECSQDGFLNSLSISSYSLIACTREAMKIMPSGGSIITMSYIGSTKVIPSYGIMGPIKACLESTVKYLAYDLASKNIRVFAISPGPIKTRAACGIKNFDQLIVENTNNAPMHRLVSTDEVGNLSSFLISDLSSGMTGNIVFVDAGEHLL